MSRYSSDSDSVDSFKRKNKKNHRRSSSSSSSSDKFSRHKKNKRHRRSRRSRSRERRGKRSRKYSRDRDRRSSRRSRSRSNSTSVSRGGGGGRKSRSWSRDRRRRSSRSESRTRRSKSRDAPSQTSTSRRPPPVSTKDDGSELLERLNKAAVQAMADNARLREATLDLVSQQTNRENVLNDINSPSFAPKVFSSTIISDLPRAADPSSSRPSPKLEALVQEVHGSLLHPNLLLDDPEDKLNRWIKKIYQIRQRAIIGEPLNFS